jgi:peptidoglycan/LPS O-acetylase OafA/YrhL
VQAESVRRCFDRLWNLLARETSSGRFLPGVDGLRFFAIAGVLVFHFHEYVGQHGAVASSGVGIDGAMDRVCAQGFVGVQLFFAISGFILALPFAEHYLADKRQPRLGSYLWRRVTRLEPPYFANLWVMYLVYGVLAGGAVAMLPHLLASMCYVHNIVYGARSTVNGVAWSLEIEVQFYLLAPLLATVFAIRSPSVRRLVLVAAIALLSAQDFTLASPWNLTLAHHLQYFLVGFLLADLHVTRWRQPSRYPMVWDAVGTLAWAGIVWAMVWQVYVFELLPPLIWLAYAGAFRGKVWPWIVSRRPLVAIGGMCYTIYLWHLLFYSHLGAWLAPYALADAYWANMLLHMALLTVGTLVPCTLLFLLLEKPFMRKDWPARYWAAVRGRLSVRRAFVPVD